MTPANIIALVIAAADHAEKIMVLVRETRETFSESDEAELDAALERLQNARQAQSAERQAALRG